MPLVPLDLLIWRVHSWPNAKAAGRKFSEVRIGSTFVVAAGLALLRVAASKGQR